MELTNGVNRIGHVNDVPDALARRSHVHAQGGARTTNTRTRGPNNSHLEGPERVTNKERPQQLTAG
eukprot:9459803-Pyramimonas_sp.AAC.1